MHKSISLLTKSSIFLIHFFAGLDTKIIRNLKSKQLHLSSVIQDSSIFDNNSNISKCMTIFSSIFLTAQIHIFELI